MTDADGFGLPPALVTRMLADHYGIDTRAGCSCAGPHALDLFAIDQATYDKVLRPWIRTRQLPAVNVVKPGWVRLNLHYTVTPAQREYVMDALLSIARHGHKLALLYQVDLQHNEWTPRVELAAGALPAVGGAPRAARAPAFSLDDCVVSPPALEIRTSADHHALLRAQLAQADALVKLIDRALRKMKIDPSRDLPESLFTPQPELGTVFKGLLESQPCARRALSYTGELLKTVAKGQRYRATTKSELVRRKFALIKQEGEPDADLDRVPCSF